MKKVLPSKCSSSDLFEVSNPDLMKELPEEALDLETTVDDIALTYNQIAGSFLDFNIASEILIARELGLLTSNAPTGGYAIDIGCGAGVYSKRLANSNLNVDAIDVSQAQIELARSRSAHSMVTWYCTDIRQFEFLPDKYDAALMNSSLHYLSFADQAVVLRSVFNSLRKGGKLLAIIKLKQSPTVESLEERFYGFFVCRRRFLNSIFSIKSTITSVGFTDPLIVHQEPHWSDRSVTFVHLVTTKY